MRTTVTLDPDVRALVEALMRDRDLTFKQALNQAVRSGLGSHRDGSTSYTTPRDLGPARVDLTKTLAIAASLEDDEIARRLAANR